MFRNSGSFRLRFAASQMVKARWGYIMIAESCLLHSPGQRMSLSIPFIRLDALCLNRSISFRNTLRLLWNDGKSSLPCLSEIKIREKTCFFSQMGTLVWHLIRNSNIRRDLYQWDSEHMNFGPCAETSHCVLLTVEVFYRIFHHSSLRICLRLNACICCFLVQLPQKRKFEKEKGKLKFSYLHNISQFLILLFQLPSDFA